MTSQNNIEEATQYLRLTKSQAEILMLAVVNLYVAHGHELNDKALDILSDFEHRIHAVDIDLFEKWKNYD